jgi:hypothetical protein
MRPKSFVLKNKFFTLVSLIFVLWLIFLVIVTFAGERSVTFFDALGQADVSSSYSSTLPFLRYIIEPFAAISFMLEMEFSWIFLFLIFYPMFRIIFYFLQRK